MKKSTKRVLIGSGAVATLTAVAGVVQYSVARKLVRIALDRELPIQRTAKSHYKISGMKETDEFSEAIQRAEEKLSGTEMEDVEVNAEDGTKLVGHWYPCSCARRTVIAMHGWRSSWARDFGPVADFLHDSGCNILFAEQRGQNNSGGDYMGFGLMERYDCLRWIRWVNETKGADLPIYLCGVSMGASTVLMATGLSLAENVKGVIADCGYTSAHDIWKHVAKNNLNLSYGVIGGVVDDLCRKKIQMGTRDYSTTEALEKTSVPVLFVHGTDDTFVPVDMTYENYRACASPKTLFIVPGAGHGRSYFVDKKGYETMVTQFFESYDRDESV